MTLTAKEPATASSVKANGTFRPYVFSSKTTFRGNNEGIALSERQHWIAGMRLFVKR